jgi:hypothetical protein
MATSVNVRNGSVAGFGGRKDGTVHRDLRKVGTGETPKVDEVIGYSADGTSISARVTAVTFTSVGSSAGQPIDIVTAEKI